jgi:hypothetical protein
MYIGSKIWKAPMKLMTTAKKRLGDSIGRVTCQKRRNTPAPSRVAASWRSRGTLWRPASRTMKMNPNVRHKSTTIKAGIAS